MKSAIEVLHQSAKVDKKKIAVLGTMPELGTKTMEYHREIGKLLFEREVNMLITIGMNTRHYRIGAIESGFQPENIFSFYSIEKLESFLEKIVSSNTVFLFKGARRINLDKTVENFISYLTQTETNNHSLTVDVDE